MAVFTECGLGSAVVWKNGAVHESLSDLANRPKNGDRRSLIRDIHHLAHSFLSVITVFRDGDGCRFHQQEDRWCPPGALGAPAASELE